VRVTPAELAGVAVQVRTLAREMLSRSSGLRSAVVDVAGPDAAAAEVLLAAARSTQAAFQEVGELLGSLLRELGATFDLQASALAGAAHGYAYVEHDVGAAFDGAGPRHGWPRHE
jgi:hypothetical protein